MSLRIFEWRERYAVGVERIDSQHRELFRLADELHAAMLAGEARPRLSEMLQRLNAYVHYHFADEEQLMTDIGYPAFAEQLRQHRELRERIAWFEERFRAGDTAITIRLMEFLAEWLTRHTTTEDSRIGAFIARSAVS